MRKDGIITSSSKKGWISNGRPEISCCIHFGRGKCCNDFAEISQLFNWNYLDVSENRGTPKSSISIGCSIINYHKLSILGYHYFWKHRYSIQLVITTKFPVFTQCHGFKKKQGLNDNLFTRPFWVIFGSFWPQSIIFITFSLGNTWLGGTRKHEWDWQQADQSQMHLTVDNGETVLHASCFPEVFLDACLCSEHRISLSVNTLAVLPVQLHISQVQDSLFGARPCLTFTIQNNILCSQEFTM